MVWTARAVGTTGTSQDLPVLTRDGKSQELGQVDMELQDGDQIEAHGFEVEFVKKDLTNEQSVLAKMRLHPDSTVKTMIQDSDLRPILMNGTKATANSSPDAAHLGTAPYLKPRPCVCPMLVVSVANAEKLTTFFHAKEIEEILSHDENGDHFNVPISRTVE